jgi:uroporphyrinogen III methyltransferase/synthase
VESYRLQVDLKPAEYCAEELAAALKSEADSHFLLARASRGREVLAETLVASGGRVDQIVVYESTDVKDIDPVVADAIANQQIDWVTVTSSAIARSLAALFGSALHQVRLASISPITSATLLELGYEPAVEAKVFTMEGLVTAMQRHIEATQGVEKQSEGSG